MSQTFDDVDAPDDPPALGWVLDEQRGSLPYALVHGEDGGSYLAANASSVNIRFPIILSDTGTGSPNGNHGRGMGLDLGGAWQSGPLTAGLSLQNIVNTFKWDVNNMYTQGMTEKFNANTRTSTRTPWRKVSTLTGAARDSVDRVVSPLKIDPTAT